MGTEASDPCRTVEIYALSSLFAELGVEFGFQKDLTIAEVQRAMVIAAMAIVATKTATLHKPGKLNSEELLEQLKSWDPDLVMSEVERTFRHECRSEAVDPISPVVARWKKERDGV